MTQQKPTEGIRDHSFSSYAKFFEQLTFFTQQNMIISTNWGIGGFQIWIYWAGRGISKITGGIISWDMKNNWGLHGIPYIEFQGAQWFWNS